MSAFKRFDGDWVSLRKLGPVEVDLHQGRRDPTRKSYDEAMGDTAELVRNELRKAHESGAEYVMFMHGRSTSMGWRGTTARSVVREVMRSREATPYIVRSECLQGDTVFLARIRAAQAAVATA